MIKVVSGTGNNNRRIKMIDMQPLGVGRIANGYYKGCIVMRTASSDNFEVMDLTESRVDGCWTCASTIEVELLPVGEKIVLEIFNER